MAGSTLLVGAFALMPLSARATSLSSPIAIDSCEVPAFINHDLIDDASSIGTGGVKIVFHNQAPVEATEVTFLVGYPGNVVTIHDVGTFSNSARIVHQYGEHFNAPDFAGSLPETCEVVSARFADGLVWTSPAMAQAMSESR